MPISLGPLAVLNLACLTVLLTVLWHMANASPPTQIASSSSNRLERVLDILTDVFSSGHDNPLDSDRPGDAEEDQRLALTTAFGGEASLFGASLFVVDLDSSLTDSIAVERTEAYHASRPVSSAQLFCCARSTGLTRTCPTRHSSGRICATVWLGHSFLTRWSSILLTRTTMPVTLWLYPQIPNSLIPWYTILIRKTGLPSSNEAADALSQPKSGMPNMPVPRLL